MVAPDFDIDVEGQCPGGGKRGTGGTGDFGGTVGMNGLVVVAESPVDGKDVEATLGGQAEAQLAFL